MAILSERHASAVTGPHRVEADKAAAASEWWLSVDPPQLADVCATLRSDPRLAFDFLNNLTVVDYLATDKRQEKAVGEPRVEVVYHLSSLARRRQLVVKATLPRWDDDGEPPELPSVAHLWATADWHEREAYDLGGVRFAGHPNLRRILCPEDWEGHPLRKDYTMPLEYHGIRGR
ncbi:MAG: NADH-quinone oxidoreductase subunit C [Planctomycetota bacterium]